MEIFGGIFRLIFWFVLFESLGELLWKLFLWGGVIWFLFHIGAC